MSKNDVVQLAAQVKDRDMHVAGRLSSARLLGDMRTSNALDVLIELASDEELQDELSRELGRSTAVVAAAIGQTKNVSDTHLVKFTAPAFDGFDTETAILQWSDQPS